MSHNTVLYYHVLQSTLMPKGESLEILLRSKPDDILSCRLELGERSLDRVRVQGRLLSIRDRVNVGVENKKKGYTLQFNGPIIDIFLEDNRTKIIVQRRQIYSVTFFIVFPEHCSIPSHSEDRFAKDYESK